MIIVQNFFVNVYYICPYYVKHTVHLDGFIVVNPCQNVGEVVFLMLLDLQSCQNKTTHVPCSKWGYSTLAFVLYY